MVMKNLPTADAMGIADKVIPLVPTIAIVYLVVAAVGAAFGFLGSLVTLSLGGMIASILGLVTAAVGYAAIIMLYRIYVRVTGG